MLRRVSIIALVACCLALPAVAQETLTIGDPAITKKPRISANGSFPEYPSAAARAGQSGETMIRTCVDVDGKPHDAELVISSGFTALDDAALAWIAKGDARFEPAEASGKPVAVCDYKFTYVWELKATNRLRPSGYVEYSTLQQAERPVFQAPTKPPPYPEKTFAARGAGLVTFMLCVAPTGQIVWMEPRKFGAGPDFLEPTIRWILQGTFTPGTVEGKPVGVCGVEAGHEWKAPG